MTWLTMLLAAAKSSGETPPGALSFVEIALIIFFVVFLFVVVWVLMKRRGYFDKAAQIPLHDDPHAPLTPREDRKES